MKKLHETFGQLSKSDFRAILDWNEKMGLFREAFFNFSPSRFKFCSVSESERIKNISEHTLSGGYTACLIHVKCWECEINVGNAI